MKSQFLISISLHLGNLIHIRFLSSSPSPNIIIIEYRHFPQRRCERNHTPMNIYCVDMYTVMAENVVEQFDSSKRSEATAAEPDWWKLQQVLLESHCNALINQ